jgi:hypothetical protein
MVPRPIARAQVVTTQPGTCPDEVGSTQAGSEALCPAAANDASARVMIPMDFCASLEPCEKAMSPAETSCMRRETVCTRPGRTRRKIQ